MRNSECGFFFGVPIPHSAFAIPNSLHSFRRVHAKNLERALDHRFHLLHQEKLHRRPFEILGNDAVFEIVVVQQACQVLKVEVSLCGS